MADQLLEQVRDFAEGQIDFEGQRLVEFLITALITAIGVSQQPLPPWYLAYLG